VNVRYVLYRYSHRFAYVYTAVFESGCWYLCVECIQNRVRKKKATKLIGKTRNIHHINNAICVDTRTDGQQLHKENIMKKQRKKITIRLFHFTRYVHHPCWSSLTECTDITHISWIKCCKMLLNKWVQFSLVIPAVSVTQLLRPHVTIFLISVPSLGVYYCQQLTLSVRMSVPLFVCHAPSNCFFFVSQWNRAIFGHHFPMWHSTKRCSSIFDLGPLTPKIYSPKFAQNRL